jgi:hypothetical protein
MHINNQHSTRLQVQFNVQISDAQGKSVYDKKSSMITINPYSVKTISTADFFSTISLSGYHGWYKMYLGVWKYGTNYAPADSYDFIGPILFAVDIGTPGQSFAKITLGCPANATITNSNGQTIGMVDGNAVNTIPDSIVLSDIEPKTYLVPRDSYDISIDGSGNGTYNLEICSPERDSSRLYSFGNVSLTTATTDHVFFNPDSSVIEFLTNEPFKYYSLTISSISENGSTSLTVSNLTAMKDSTYKFQVLDWSALGNISVNSTLLSVDRDGDGIFEKELGIHNGMSAEEISDGLQPESRLSGDVIALSVIVVIACAIAAITVGMIRSLRRTRRT